MAASSEGRRKKSPPVSPAVASHAHRLNIAVDKTQQEMLQHLLAWLDNMDRLLQTPLPEDPAGWEQYRHGAQLLADGFQQVMASLDIECYAAVGDAFDPHCMEAVGAVAGEISGTVAQVIRPGWRRVNGDAYAVLRVAQVLVVA